MNDDQIVTIPADYVQVGDMLVGRGIVTDVSQSAIHVDITYEKTGTSSGLGLLSCRWDMQVKVKR